MAEKKILVVDDEADIRDTVKAVLEKNGYGVVTAVNGDEGLEKLIAEKKIRDWPNHEDIIKEMQNGIDDYLFDLEESHGLKLATEDMDLIIERCIAIARKLAGD